MGKGTEPDKEGLPEELGKPSDLQQETDKIELGEMGKERPPEELCTPSDLKQEKGKSELGETGKGATGTEEKSEDVEKGVQIPNKGVEASQ